MVNGALSLAGIAGVLLSGAFVYFEVGRFAAPQVPTSRFDERRELFAYTAGLFVGVPIAFALLLLLSAVANGALISALIDVVLVAGATELAQWGLGRTRYFGRAAATPFYALGFRAGLSAILVLAVVASVLSALSVTWDALVLAAAQSVALLFLEVNGALLSVPRSAEVPGARGGPLSGLLVGVAGLGLLALGDSLGALAGTAAALLVTGGLLPSYRRLRRRVLEPEPVGAGEASTGPARPRFGRTD